VRALDDNSCQAIDNVKRSGKLLAGGFWSRHR